MTTDTTSATPAEHGWPTDTGPLCTLRDRFPESSVDWLVDPWRVPRSDLPSQWVYVAEPSRLRPDDLTELDWLTHNGWDVEVGTEVRHNRDGRAVAVRITPGEWSRLA
ncbi:hypothetical protein H7X46_22530 [Pseudonocardia sp. C8]|uniref:hypothetical protein n=1 Tax=Pseudonocardia sp. C8 TaxID=2762759 RepID=UPI001642D5BD|nr:hypothetical protein [Pseudonocardia sp. C8]MBC3193842.1 hypothetical protein [Pseudonocardia sp. C8]